MWADAYHDGKVFVPNAIVVDRWLKKMGILLEPREGGEGVSR